MQTGTVGIVQKVPNTSQNSFSRINADRFTIHIDPSGFDDTPIRMLFVGDNMNWRQAGHWGGSLYGTIGVGIAERSCIPLCEHDPK